MKKRIGIILLILALTFSLTACGGGEKAQTDKDAAAGGYPMTVTDYLGTEMTIEQAPEKIASLSPSCTEILYELGLGDKVVGVSTWCNYPKEVKDKEVLGDTFNVNVEKIIELDCDIVFVSGQTSADLATSLDSVGIPVYSIGAKNLNEIYNSITNVGTITDTAKQAETLAGNIREKADVLKEKFGKYESKRVFIDMGDLYSCSKKDYLGNSLELINGENIALDFDQSSPQLSAETVIEKNPQVYIAMSPEKDFVQPKGFEQIDAFKNDQVYYIDHTDPAADMITRDGPRFVDGLEILGNLIHTGKKQSAE